MAKDWTAPLDTVNFHCGACKRAFSGRPDLVEEAPDAAHHPHRYFAHCPRCQAQHQPQAGWEKALMKAHQASTGPKTAEGLKKAAANLAGHPTPEEAMRTRFNAMKHGLTARTATYFPARPGGYAFCERCEVDRTWCGEQPACVKQTEIFLLHHAAHEQRDPRVLAGLHADIQGGLTAMLQMLMQQALGDGVVIKQPRVELDRNGVSQTLTYEDGTTGKRLYIYDYQAHPALKPIADLISRLGLSVNDLGMSPRTAIEEEDKTGGKLGLEDSAPEALADFGKRMLLSMQGARELLAKADELTRNDPVLVAHEAAEGKVK